MFNNDTYGFRPITEDSFELRLLKKILPQGTPEPVARSFIKRKDAMNHLWDYSGEIKKSLENTSPDIIIEARLADVALEGLRSPYSAVDSEIWTWAGTLHATKAIGDKTPHTYRVIIEEFISQILENELPDLEAAFESCRDFVDQLPDLYIDLQKEMQGAVEYAKIKQYPTVEIRRYAVDQAVESARSRYEYKKALETPLSIAYRAYRRYLEALGSVKLEIFYSINKDNPFIFAYKIDGKTYAMVLTAPPVSMGTRLLTPNGKRRK